MNLDELAQQHLNEIVAEFGPIVGEHYLTAMRAIWIAMAELDGPEEAQHYRTILLRHIQEIINHFPSI